MSSSGEEEEVGPSVDSNNPEERIAARRIRIQRRIEAAKRAALGEDPNEKKEVKEELSKSRKQIEESRLRLTKLKQDGFELVTNIRVAGDSREASRRTEEEDAKRIRKERLEQEAKSGAERFEEITKKWESALQKEIPQSLHEMLMQQKTSCDAMIDEKNKLINDFQQGYHYLCLICTNHFFRRRYEVQRHLQGQHTGLGYQCSVCKMLFQMRNYKHSCNVREADMLYIHRETGVRGEPARQMMLKFINERQDTLWKYVERLDDLDESESPFPSVRSVVTKVNDLPRIPRPRKEKRGSSVLSDLPLEEPDIISVEEPPVKVPRKEVTTTTCASLLAELECTPSQSISGSDTETDCSDSDLDYNDDIENQVNECEITENQINGGNHNKREENKVSEKEKEKEHRNDRMTEERNKDSRKQTQVSEENKREKNEKSKKSETESTMAKGVEKSIEKENQKQKETETDKMKKKSTENKCNENVRKDTKNAETVVNSEKVKSKEKVGETKKDKERNSGNEKAKENKNKTSERNVKDKGEDDDKKGKEKKKETYKDKVKDKQTDNKEHKQHKNKTANKTDDLRDRITEDSEITRNKKDDENKKDYAKESRTEEIRECNKSANVGDSIVDNIMNDMNKTFSTTVSDYDYEETVNAVASIAEPSAVEVEDPGVEKVAEQAVLFFEELIILEEIDKGGKEVAEEIVKARCEVEEIVGEEITKEMLAIARESKLDCSLEEARKKDIEKVKKRKLELSENKEISVTESETEEQSQNSNENKRQKIIEADATIIVNEEINNEDIDEDIRYLKEVQQKRIIVNVGGVRFETTRMTLCKDPKSLLARALSRNSPITLQGNSLFLDRDPSHFKIILNYLRNDCSIRSPNDLPKEVKYLYELQDECKYYCLRGLKKIVKRRLKQLTEVYGTE